MRVKRGVASHKKHKKLLSSVKGYRMTKHKLVKAAKEAYLHAGKYAYAGRKNKKTDFRRLWITRITQALKIYGLKYSKFIYQLKNANIIVDRKILANLIVNDQKVFKAVIDKIKQS